MKSGPIASFALAVCLVCLAGLASAQDQPSQPAPNTPATSPAPSTPAPKAPVPTTPGAPSTPAPAPPIAAPAPSNGGESGAPGIPSSGASTESVDIASRPAAILSGKAKWDDGFTAIKASIGKIEAALTAAGLKPAGSPLTVFTATDDNGFSYEAMVPLAEKPAGKDQLTDDVKLGASPSGKAIKFQHRGPYDDIDSTYDLITAYLDEKGLESQSRFIEEYLTDTSEPDDANLEADIYVFLK